VEADVTKPILLKVCPHCKRRFEKPPKVSATQWAGRKLCGIACATEARIIPLAQRFWAKVDRSAGLGSCWLWTASRSRRGYGEIGRGRAGEGIILAHRLSWELHHGPIPTGLSVLHHCDNPPCVNPAHLWLGTHQDNQDDMIRKRRDRKRPLRGEEHHQAKLTNEQVLDIRRRLSARERQWRLAREFGVSCSTIQAIAHGCSWRHLL
jgi:hypothetical protein